ncbi:MAG: shikimate kinase [Bacteroidales bacterium]|nr:shikimate kinase [Bacteroidales bacterium]
MLVYLIGYMGCGKSTIGPRLARLLEYQWLDLDEAIEDKYHISIHKIFEKYGEENFRMIEKTALEQTFSLNNTVISTGGGTPCYFDNLQIMKANGLVIYIKLSPGMLLNRLSISKKPRPILRDLSADDLKNKITDQIIQRSEFYEKAHIIITHNHATPSRMAELIHLHETGGRFI